MLMARSGRTSVRSRAKYARVSPRRCSATRPSATPRGAGSAAVAPPSGRPYPVSGNCDQPLHRKHLVVMGSVFAATSS
jgi:hypothetical protein